MTVGIASSPLLLAGRRRVANSVCASLGDRLDDALEWHRRAAQRVADSSGGRGLEEEEARFVLRYEDRTQMTHGCSVACERLRGQLGPSGSVWSAGSVASRDIELDEELGHMPTLRPCAAR
jgi:hypothetical protein